jgi:hypothetical protein
MMLSEDKVSHITHLLLERIKKDKLAKLIVDEIKILREMKGIINSEIKLDAEIDVIVRRKLDSYSKKIIESSSEWNVLYQKFFKEELKNKRR